MSLQEWYQKAQSFNAGASRRCPRRPPCSQRTDAAVYEYVTGKEGPAIILRCLQCGAIHHIVTSSGTGALFEPVWQLGEARPEASRVVHLPGEPTVRTKRQQKRGK